MQRSRLKSLALLSLMLGAAPAFGAQPAIPAYSCRNGLFAGAKGHQFQLGRIQGPARSYFFKDDQGCPTGKGCKTDAYVIPGDRVILNQIVSGWACVWYQGKVNETVGWIPQNQIALTPASPIQLKDWIGHWGFSDAASLSLQPAADGKSLSIAGEAFWYGLVVNGERVVHVGNLESPRVVPQQGRIHYGEGDDKWSCKAELVLLPPYLIVDDNQNCGGMNVSFRGIYTRK